MSQVQLTARRIYGWPAVLGVITLGGLLFALLGDGLWDEISWLLLAVPLLIILRKVFGKDLRA